MNTSWNWNRIQELNVSQRFTSKHYQHCAYEVGKLDGIQMELSSAPAPFQPHVLEKADKHWCNWNTESGGNSSYSERERALVHPQRSHGAALSLHTGPRCLWCMALFPSLSHQSYIIDSEGRVMFYKVKHINGFHCTLRCLDVLGSVSGGLK